MTLTQGELQARIIRLAGEDDVFRAQLLSDPKAAIQEVTGAVIPHAIKVEVHQESATTFHLVLPPDSRLTEGEMAQVFGGAWYDTMGGG